MAGGDESPAETARDSSDTQTQESTMSTTTTSLRSTHGLIATAILTTLISSFSALCSAADAGEVPQAIVKYGDLDVTSTAGAATLFNRIRAASQTVCAPLAGGDFVAMFRWEKCVKQAIGGAVAKVNQPALSAAYAAKYGVPQPAKILTADRR
jgi:UrcA family protein